MEQTDSFSFSLPQPRRSIEKQQTSDFKQHPISVSSSLLQEVCPADDLFFNGQLLPLHHPACAKQVVDPLAEGMPSFLHHKSVSCGIPSAHKKPFMEDARPFSFESDWDSEKYSSRSSSNNSQKSSTVNRPSAATASITKSVPRQLSRGSSFKWSLFSLKPFNPSHLRGDESEARARRLSASLSGRKLTHQKSCGDPKPTNQAKGKANNAAGKSVSSNVKKESAHMQKSWKILKPFYGLFSRSSYARQMWFGDCKEATEEVAEGSHVVRSVTDQKTKSDEGAIKGAIEHCKQSQSEQERLRCKPCMKSHYNFHQNHLPAEGTCF